MDQEEFLSLDMSDRIQILWSEGELIAECAQYGSRVTLFLLEDFYVEVFFDPVDQTLLGILPQDNAEILYSYASEVSLKEIEGLLH